MRRLHSLIHRIPILFAALLLIAPIAGCGDDTPTSPSVGLSVPFSTRDLVVGTGQEAMNGDILSVNYTGWLYDPDAPENKGDQFDSSVGRAPFEFTLGVGAVIAGWDRGLLGMRVGGRRIIVIPPELGYGADGSPPRIPGNATLLFDVDIRQSKPSRQLDGFHLE